MKTKEELAKEYAESFQENDYTIETEAAFIAGFEAAQKATTSELLESEIENLEFLKWIASKSREFNMWSDKVELLHKRIANTEAAIKKTNLK